MKLLTIAEKVMIFREGIVTESAKPQTTFNITSLENLKRLGNVSKFSIFKEEINNVEEVRSSGKPIEPGVETFQLRTNR